MRISDWSSDVCSSDVLFRSAANAEFGLSSHPFNLLAHFGKGGINALAFHLDIFGNRVLYRYARLMKYSVTARHAHDDRQSRQHDGRGILHADMRRTVIDQPGIGDEFGQHHCNSLQCFNFHLGIAVGFHMLHRQDPNRSEEHTSELQSLMSISYSL